MLKSLAPRLWRGLTEGAIARNAGAKFDLVTNFAWGTPKQLHPRTDGSPPQPTWFPAGAPPYGSDPRHPDWTNYERFLLELTRLHRANPPNYWEFWNEPDLAYSWPRTFPDTDIAHRCPVKIPDDINLTSLFQTYEVFHRTLKRELGRDTMLIAPSLNSYCVPLLTKFLDYALAQKLDVNVLAWHELAATQNDLPAIAAHLKDARTRFFSAKYRPLNLREIHIHETVGPAHTTHPGEAVAYLDMLERGGADYAARACFGDPTDELGGRPSGCQNNTLDSILVPLLPGAARDTPRETRATYWVYERYAQLRNQRATCTTSHVQVACIAGINADGDPTVLLGSYANDGTAAVPVTVEFKGMEVRRAVISIARLASGDGPVAAPVTIKEVSIDQKLRLLVPGLSPHEAVILTMKNRR